jgi:hypothetical protein
MIEHQEPVFCIWACSALANMKTDHRDECPWRNTLQVCEKPSAIVGYLMTPQKIRPCSEPSHENKELKKTVSTIIRRLIIERRR